MTPPVFTADAGHVLFEGRPLRQITRARIKSQLQAMGETTRNVETLNRLHGVWMQLIRASVEANNQARASGQRSIAA